MSYVLFISEQKLAESTAINLNVDTDLLLPYVRQAQKLYVETKLGTDLNQKLKDLITQFHSLDLKLKMETYILKPLKQERLYPQKKRNTLEKKLGILLSITQNV